jgi:DNA mismatch repair protein MLH3
LDIPHKLSKADLQNARVLGQVDKKYIVIKLNGEGKGLVMIDQHAADERVQLEEMMKHASTFIPATLEPSICLELDSPYEYQIITSEHILNSLKIWGIQIITTTNATSASVNNDNVMVTNSSNNEEAQHEHDNAAAMLLSQSRFFSTSKTSPHFFNDIPEQQQHNNLMAAEKSKRKSYLNRVYVTQLPQLIIDRCVMNHALLKDLIRDYAYWLKDQKDVTSLHKTCPRGIMEILKSRACRSMYTTFITYRQNVLIFYFINRRHYV